MDSHTTLVNPFLSSATSAIPASNTTLIFSTDNIRNATISILTPAASESSGTPIYTLSSTYRNGFRTEIRHADTRSLVALIERRDIMPDLVTFDGAKAVKISKWLKKEKLPDGSPVHVLKTTHGEFFCKSDNKYRLALYSYSDSSASTPLAYYTRALTADTHSTITLTPSAMILCEHALVAFLYLEHKIRMAENMSNGGQGLRQLEGLRMGQTITGM